jgi:glycosyltransferase involved in cell wall biosynthesis
MSLEKGLICLHVNSFDNGGAEGVFCQLANYLAKCGYKVDVVLIHKRGTLLERLDKRVNVIELGCSHSIFSVPYLVRYLNKNKPDVMLSTLKENNVMSVIAKLLSKSKTSLILREANTLSAELNFEKPIMRFVKTMLIKFSYPKANNIIALSNSMKLDICTFTSAIPESVKVIYNPVDSMFNQERARNKLPIKIEPGRKLIVSMARVVPQKGYKEILDALVIAQNSLDDYLFVGIGAGPYICEFEEYSRLIGIENKVLFIGHLENPFPILAKADCFVLASYFEGMPNSLLQAMSLGVPVVSTDSPGAAREILVDGKYGALVPLGDSTKLAESIVSAINFPKTSSVRFVEENFKAEKILFDYLKLIETYV